MRPGHPVQLCAAGQAAPRPRPDTALPHPRMQGQPGGIVGLAQVLRPPSGRRQGRQDRGAFSPAAPSSAAMRTNGPGVCLPAVHQDHRCRRAIGQPGITACRRILLQPLHPSPAKAGRGQKGAGRVIDLCHAGHPSNLCHTGLPPRLPAECESPALAAGCQGGRAIRSGRSRGPAPHPGPVRSTHLRIPDDKGPECQIRPPGAS